MQPNTEAPAPRGQCPPSWADEQLASLRAKLPDWHVWYVRNYMNPSGHFTWCAMPNGAMIATCHGADPDALILATDEFTAGLAHHIQAARSELGNPQVWADRRNVVEHQLTGMTRLQSRTA